ncbi:MAG: hypothetical protein ACJLTB_09360 [Algoriphagus aquaeductus]|uniref:hypothetical protein n=1 Tax=Algoriphagus TaxID=246875 RepID=UPI002589AC0F|nr:hypothetical protein [Algoriphagus sp.]
MGFIPLFLTMGGACLLFFLTVKNTLQKKLILQRELFAQLGNAHPELGLKSGELADPDKIMDSWKTAPEKKSVPQKSLDLIRELKVNRHQYNALIKKAPYNWVAAIGGFHAI